MKRSVALAVMCSAVLAAAGCATGVGGTAQMGPQPYPASSASTPSESASGSVTPSESTESSKQLTENSASASSAGSSAPTTSFSAEQSPGGAASVSPPAAPPPSAPSTVSKPTTTKALTPPTTTRALTPTTTHTVPKSPSGPSRPTKLHCAKGAITANDAPFCYLLPAGFLDASATATFPGADPIRTAVAPIGDGHVGAKDLIFVLSTDLSTDSDNVSDALLKAALKKALDAGVPGTTKVTPVVQLSVAGDRAFESDITFTGGAQKRYIIIFSGRHRVSISCQWQTNKAIIASGCAAVLKTLQIANP